MHKLCWIYFIRARCIISNITITTENKLKIFRIKESTYKFFRECYHHMSIASAFKKKTYCVVETSNGLPTKTFVIESKSINTVGC